MGLSRHLSRQLLLQLLKSGEGGRRIRAERISLNHPHIPAAGALLERNRAEGKLKKCRRQRRGQNQPPAGLAAMQGREHRSHPGTMAIAMAADAGVDQHGCKAERRISVCR